MEVEGVGGRYNQSNGDPRLMDRVSRRTRSSIMSHIRKRGNRSTESRLRACLVSSGIRGWRLHDKAIVGCPDFSFPASKLAVFVDGCFWHLCPHCGRPPHSRLSYWRPKLENNRRRDRIVSQNLKRNGWRVIRFWEHDISHSPSNAVERIERVIGPR